eukprot:TRINITY_DN112266_c0_g1_i1.p1 TRINITY_DN112266_c0_g1~~TRINITY_DN112266_c0_g1_i1.p1  ORF type:complete len:299 (+),score=29.65 TRINITY_DN112266_c0_g1_i1:50-946(+)
MERQESCSREEDGGDFTLVVKGKKAKYTGHLRHRVRISWVPLFDPEYPKQHQRKLCELLCSYEQQIKSSAELDWIRDWLAERFTHKQISPHTVPVQCVGLGAPTKTYSQLQLAFLKLLHREFEFASVTIHEPSLNRSDKRVIVDYFGDDVTIAKENVEGKIATTCPTLMYMLHCPPALYSNLFVHNWNPENLQNILLIGNSMSWIVSEPMARFEAATLLGEGLVETAPTSNNAVLTRRAFSCTSCTHVNVPDKPAMWEKVPKPPIKSCHIRVRKFKYKEPRPCRQRKSHKHSRIKSTE